MECLLPYISKVDVPHKMVGLERMSDYRGVGLERFHCTMHGYPCTLTHASIAIVHHACELHAW